MDISKKNKYLKKIFITVILSVILGLLFSTYYTYHTYKCINVVIFFYRFVIFYPVFLFITLHFVVPIKQLYEWLFKHRWLIGVLILAYATVFRFHGDSISIYSDNVQPNCSNIYSQPFFGLARYIRTDEYIVTTPSILASGLGSHPFAQYTDILRGTETLTITNGVYLGLATLPLAPWELIYAILPVEYAYSFCWYAPLVLAFLMSLEMFYIISKNKLTSVIGASLVVLSSFYVWWGFNSYFITGPGTIFAVYKFLNSENKYKKILFGILTAWCFSGFIVSLYPAWQVPLGYLYLVIGVWVLCTNWDAVKKLDKKDYVIIGISLLLCILLVGVYFITIKDYVTAINNTVYPGKRIDNGQFALNKIFYYGQSLFYPFTDVGNSSEASVFFSMFPIPTIMALYCCLKEKKKDGLLIGLLVVQFIFILYTTVGLPSIIAKLTMLSNSTAQRTIDILGYSEVILIVCLFSKNREKIKLPYVLGIIISAITAYLCIYVSFSDFPNYLTLKKIVFVFVLIFVLGLMLTVRLKVKLNTALKVTLIGATLMASAKVRPIMVGLDAIYAKPVAQEILSITEKDKNSKWLTLGGNHIMGIAVSCGAPTINFVNTYPNLDLWHKLDPKHKYEHIYNRYEHVGVLLTDEDTSFKLEYPDAITLNLSYKDIYKTKVKYVATLGDQNLNFNNGYVSFDKIYDEDGAKIYKLSYN